MDYSGATRLLAVIRLQGERRRYLCACMYGGVGPVFFLSISCNLVIRVVGSQVDNLGQTRVREFACFMVPCWGGILVCSCECSVIAQYSVIWKLI